MVRIDFIGAPGCGKTTLVNRFIKANLLDEAYKLSDARKWVLRNYFPENHEFSKNSPYLYLISRLMERLNPSYDKPRLKAFLLTSMNQFDTLLTSIFFNLSRSNLGKSAYLSLKRLGWFIRILEDVLIVTEFAKDSVILCDEALTSKLYQNYFGMIGKELDDNLKNILLPKGVIYVYCDREIIWERLLSRRKITFGHSGMLAGGIYNSVDDQIKQAGIVRKELVDQNVNVLDINSAESIDVNLEKIKQFIEKMTADE